MQQKHLVSVRLSSEEGFFLAYAVGALHLYDDVGACGIEALWLSLTQENPNFVYSCVAYQHFRSKGWVPRSGLQYGVDLVLYEQHPSLVHSTTCVIIVPMRPIENDSAAGMTDPGAMLNGQNGNLSWQDVEGINRLCIRVGKRLILLYVQPQADLDMATPACLQHFAVAEHNVERWVPEASIKLM